jgi:alpha-amylase
MTSIFQNLKERFKALGNEISPEVLEQSKSLLEEWLAANNRQLAERRHDTNLNGTMMQYFHWYIPSDGSLWNELHDRASDLATAGFTALWLPPAFKGNGGGYDVGYGVYDWFDLGEFDQKGSVRTKYGTKDEYVAAVKTAQQSGLNIYADVVFNHKMGADAEEEFEATPFDPTDRHRPLEGLQPIKSWTAFNFSGRNNRYSSMKWHWYHFDAVDFNSYKPDYRAVYLVKDKAFDSKVDLRQGNYDYLMGCDLDMDHPEVIGELKYWGEWFMDTVGVDGFRLDAIKHIQGDFFNHWLDHLEQYTKRRLFTVGEYWTEDLRTLDWYIGNAGGRINLFDVPLHYNFHRASKIGKSFDMRSVFDNTLVRHAPLFAVTFVDNHDSQPLQALESVVEGWFKPLAYALILLRAEGYPCVFYADYYGAHYKDKAPNGQEYEIWMDAHQWMLDRLVFARKHYAYGPQYDYFDHPNVIGWTRLGSEEHPKAMAVLMSNGEAGWKWMEVGKPNTTFYDVTEHIKVPVKTNEYGWGEFRCNGGSVSVWLEQQSLLTNFMKLVAGSGVLLKN